MATTALASLFAVVSPAPTAVASTPDGGAPTPPVAATAEPAAPPAANQPAAARAADREEPVRPAVRRASPAAPGEPDLSGRRPGSGVSLFCGLAFGGDDFVTTSNGMGDRMSLTAGGGVIFGVNGMVTPLWLADDSVGLGVGADVGGKYDSIEASNGKASITRFPIAFTAHLLTNGSGGNHYLLLRGGVTRDFAVNYRVSGIASIDANIDGTWGPTGALGYYKRSAESFAWHLLGFFSLTDHVVGTERIDADAFGLTLGFHLTL